ncbi:hypothetical protein [Pseudomonas donghuensis]|uniref:hypothetical protein n=1 Tax=Pseudomonas donghuensis TaxID=1163398 RepID=UPI00215FA2E3|nr:hypothetical protein [Pseudomonas donghuensis]UVL27177.1 hypothetical protein LOY32_13175 [Pseudomonas donghuensis]
MIKNGISPGFSWGGEIFQTPVLTFQDGSQGQGRWYSSGGQLSAFYDDLQQEVHALLVGYLTYRATEEPEVAAVEILAQMSRHERVACERGKMLLEWYGKVLEEAGTANQQSQVGA